MRREREGGAVHLALHQPLPASGPTPAAHPAEARSPKPPAPDPASVLAALDELDQLTGLQAVKASLREFAAFARIQGWRAAAGLPPQRVVMHMVFAGNPGTGKTTVARIVARLLRGLGLLTSGHLVECERADLVGEYIGHTAHRTRDAVRRALGGVLFVDEAYSLCRGGERDFGREAADALVKAMEDHRDAFALILAGYGAEMERLLRINPGLRSRLSLHLDFPDLSADQLLRVAEGMAGARGYRLTPAARLRLAEMVRGPSAALALSSGNARLMRNVVERAMRRQASRLLRAVEGGGPVPALQALRDLLAEDFDTSLRAAAGLQAWAPMQAVWEDAGPVAASAG